MYTVTQIHIQVNPTQSATRWVTLYSTVLLQREIAYRVDLFQSQVPCYNRSIPGSPSDLNTINGTEGAMVCTSLGSLLRPLFYFLRSNLKANPVLTVSH